MPAHFQPVTAALGALPAGAAEPEFLAAVARVSCVHLGFSRAWLCTSPPGGGQEAAAAGLFRFEMPQGLVFHGEGPGQAEAAVAFLTVAGRLLEEVRLRARLAERLQEVGRRGREAEERHRSLLLRLAELRGELDSSQQRQVILSERNRIAQDLHDRAAQTNFLVVLKLDWVLAHVPPESPMRPELERLKELASQAAAQTREAIYALRAPELEEGGLTAGIRTLLRPLRADGLDADLTVAGVPQPLPSEVEDGLFKLAQEALNNVRKHSQGSAVMVTLRFTPATVTLVVQDNGVGLRQGAGAAEAGRFGLRGMRERVAALCGELALLHGDEGGLIIRATIPIGKR